MRCAVCLRGLSSRAGIDPYANGGSLSVRGILTGDLCLALVLCFVTASIAPGIICFCKSPTVKPFLRVVDCTLRPGVATGVARPRRSGGNERPARGALRPWRRFRANRLDAMGAREECESENWFVGRSTGGRRRREKQNSEGGVRKVNAYKVSCQFTFSLEACFSWRAKELEKKCGCLTRQARHSKWSAKSAAGNDRDKLPRRPLGQSSVAAASIVT